MEITKGIESIKLAVMKDCSEGNDCFNPNGCDKEFTKMVPQTNPRLLEMGIKEACMAQTKCFHKYCDKFKWINDRAKHYAESLNTTEEKVIQGWENERTYWYMNFYQDSKQPLIDNVKVFETLEELEKSVSGKGFRCPKCSGISKDAYECSLGGCDWKSYGLFGTMNKGVNVLIKSTLKKDHIFMPVAWEND